jgi:heat shock protein HslJ
MKRWLISAVTLTFALGAAGAVTAFVLTAGGGANPEPRDSTGQTGDVSTGLPSYDEPLSDPGDGQVVTSIDDIDPNVCNAVHNIDACTPEEMEELGMAPVTGSIAAGEPYPGGEGVVTGIDDTQWILKSYGDPDDAETVLKGSEITAVFDGREGSVIGSGGCNTYSGSYETEDGTLAVDRLASTEMGCLGPDPSNEDYGRQLMDQEQRYLSALAAVGSFEVDKDQLQVTSSDGLVLTFSRVSRLEPGDARNTGRECAVEQGVYITSDGQTGCVDVNVLDDVRQDPVQAYPPVVAPQALPSAG